MGRLEPIPQPWGRRVGRRLCARKEERRRTLARTPPADALHPHARRPARDQAPGTGAQERSVARGGGGRGGMPTPTPRTWCKRTSSPPRATSPRHPPNKGTRSTYATGATLAGGVCAAVERRVGFPPPPRSPPPRRPQTPEGGRGGGGSRKGAAPWAAQVAAAAAEGGGAAAEAAAEAGEERARLAAAPRWCACWRARHGHAPHELNELPTRIPEWHTAVRSIQAQLG